MPISNSKYTISKEQTNVIKGIALIMMFIHHFFTFPSWHSEIITYPVFDDIFAKFNGTMKMCVPIFAFITGYFYKKKGFKYSLKKITDLFTVYFFCYLFLLLTVIITNREYAVSAKDIFWELLLVKEPIVKFGWYIFFYYLLMIFLPLFLKITRSRPLMVILLGVLIPSICFSLFSLYLTFPDTFYYNFITTMATNFFLYFPMAAIGHLFSEYNLYSYIQKFIYKGFHSKAAKLTIDILILLFCLLGNCVSPYVHFLCYFSLNFLYVPFFVFAIVEITNHVRIKYLYTALGYIGKYSLYMWLLHSCFFNPSGVVLKKVLYFPQNPLPVLLWGTAICLVFAVVLDKPASKINSYKNKIIFKEDPS